MPSRVSPLLSPPQATYCLTAGDELEMDFRAETDAATPVALTNHAYWNLSGDLRRSVHDHTLQVAAPAYLALDGTQVRACVRACVAAHGGFKFKHAHADVALAALANNVVLSLHCLLGGQIPTGEQASVEGTPLDLRQGARLGDRIPQARR